MCTVSFCVWNLHVHLDAPAQEIRQEESADFCIHRYSQCMQSLLISKPGGGLRKERRSVYTQFHGFQSIILLTLLRRDLSAYGMWMYKLRHITALALMCCMHKAGIKTQFNWLLGFALIQGVKHLFCSSCNLQCHHFDEISGIASTFRACTWSGGLVCYLSSRAGWEGHLLALVTTQVTWGWGSQMTASVLLTALLTWTTLPRALFTSLLWSLQSRCI